MRVRARTLVLVAVLCAFGALDPLLRADTRSGFTPSDLSQLRSVGEVQISPDAARVAYSVIVNDGPGRPSSQVWMLDVASGRPARLPGAAAQPRWSPDGRRLAYYGRAGDAWGLMTSAADGSDPVFLAPVGGTNHPLPSSGEEMAWSPDGSRLAFISSAPGPEQDANGDPMVITRYLYKPTASEGLTRFNDNRRLHIFIVEVATKSVRQLTGGDYYEHSIAWSPSGEEIAFVSNRGPDPDRFFNYDLFAVRVGDGTVRTITDTKSAEYVPAWSPDGRTLAFLATKRPLTSSETTMEDTHVWLVDADGRNRREIGGEIDNRQGAPLWAPDGRSVYFTVQERGSVHLYQLPTGGGQARAIVNETGSVGQWSIARNSTVAYALSTPGSPAELFLAQARAQTPRATRALSSLNHELLASRAVAPVAPFTFKSFDGAEIEAFLTRPPALAPGSSHPMIVIVHGGPHGQQGPAFNWKAQVYAARGWASLMVNYRGSTGYGQKLADAIFKDQNGGDAKDVLAGVDAALARYSWIDPDRLGIEGGSYGGQLTNWIITQTVRFKAAIPIASIANLVSFNYMAYYHDYLAVEFGSFPHENGLMDLLWERSPIRHVAKVRTPTLLAHGENDNDVPVAEAEQFYIALKDAGVETVMVRYPREGHGVREVRHQIDLLERSIAWYETHFRLY